MNEENQTKQLVAPKYDKWVYAVLGVVLGLVVGVGTISLMQGSYTPAPVQTGTSTANASTVSAAVMAKGVDQMANPTNVTSQFNSKIDKSVYMVLTLKNAKKADKLVYVRYYNGNYVDSSEASPSQDGVTHFYFNWNKTGSLSYPTGVYLIKIYDNGTLVNSVAYSVI